MKPSQSLSDLRNGGSAHQQQQIDEEPSPDCSLEVEVFVPNLMCKLPSQSTSGKISSIAYCNDKLLLGLSSGDLEVFSVDVDTGDDLVTLKKSISGFSNKSIDKLGLMQSVGLLVVLTDGFVSLYDLESFELNKKLMDTKGATYFSIFNGPAHDGSDTEVLRLVSVSKRRILIYDWVDSEIIQHDEILVPEKVKCVDFINSNKLVADTYTGHYLVDVQSNKLTNVSFYPHGKPLMNNMSLNYYFRSSQENEPKVVGITDNNTALLLKDSYTRFIDSEGHVLRNKTPFVFHSPPSRIELFYPYYICIYKSHIEVRNIESFCLLQVIEIPDVKFVSSTKGSLYVSTYNEVYMLNFTDLKQQIFTISEHRGHLSEAISLVELISDTLLPEKNRVLRDLKIRYASALFVKKKKYMRALSILSQVSAVPSDVIAFFPSQISGTASDLINNSDLDKAYDSMSISSRTNTLNSVMTQDHDHDLSEVSSQVEIESESSIPVQLTGNDFVVAVKGLENFLVDSRRKVYALSRPIYEEQPVLEDIDLLKSVYGSDSASLKATATLIDTTLFKCYTLRSPRLVGSLLRLPNFCDPNEVRVILSKLEKYKDLIDFYFAKKLHKEALDQLRALAIDPDSTIDKNYKSPEETVKYLQKLDNTYIDIIFEFLDWPISVSESYGIDVFLNETRESESLNKTKVLSYLQSISKYLTIKYLEYLVEKKGEISTHFHTSLAVAYVEYIAATEDEETFAKACAFLKSTPHHYRVERVLSNLPKVTSSKMLLELKAILYGKRGQHEEALKIYTFEIRDEVKARIYCSNLYDRDEKEGVAALHTLMSLYLAPPVKNEPQRLDLALDLLAVQGSRMSVVDIINALPDTTSISQIATFLTSQIRSLNKAKNDIEMEASLSKVNLAKTQEDLLNTQNKAITITNMKTCKMCFKRLGHSVISVYPNNVVVHYGCSKAYERQLEEQKEKENSKRQKDKYRKS